MGAAAGGPVPGEVGGRAAANPPHQLANMASSGAHPLAQPTGPESGADRMPLRECSRPSHQNARFAPYGERSVEQSVQFRQPGDQVNVEMSMVHRNSRPCGNSGSSFRSDGGAGSHGIGGLGGENSFALVPSAPSSGNPMFGAGAVLPSLQTFRGYQKLVNDILDKTDVEFISGKRIIKRSGWQKLAVAFNVSFELREQNIQRNDQGNVVTATFVEVRYRLIRGSFSSLMSSCSMAPFCAHGGRCDLL